MAREKVDELLNQTLKMKRISGEIIVQVVNKKDNGFYNLRVVRGNEVFKVGDEIPSTVNELKYATKVSSSFSN